MEQTNTPDAAAIAAKEAKELAAKQKAETAAAKKVEAAEKKAAADKAKADAKAEKEAKAKAEKDAAAEKLAADAQAKADAIQAKKDKVAADKAAKEQAKLDAKAAKEANKMPEQNGVRRPKPEGLCGRAWALADKLSADLGSPVPVATLLTAAVPEGLNEGNVKTEYARWRKFNGVTGRIVPPAPVVAPSSDAGAGAPAA